MFRTSLLAALTAATLLASTSLASAWIVTNGGGNNSVAMGGVAVIAIEIPTQPE